jgi:hypothetical protein
MLKTKIVLHYVKDPDSFPDMAEELGLSEEVRRKFLQHGEYANLELQVDEDLNVLGGKFLPFD